MAALFRIADVDVSLEFEQVGAGADYVRIAMANPSDVALLDSAGMLYVMGGVNGLGGSGVTGILTEPTPVAGGPWIDVATMASGIATQVLLVHEDGTLWGYGFSNSGMFGQGTASSTFLYLSPLNLGSGWARIWCAPQGVYGAKTDGSLWTWGLGFLGNNTAWAQRNVPTLTSFPTATWVGFSRNLCALTDTGAVYSLGYAPGHGFASGSEVRTVAQIPSLPAMQSLHGHLHPLHNDFQPVFAIAADGALYGWGWNGYGELSPEVPVGSTQATPLWLDAGPWADVSSTARSVCGLRTNGDIYLWGDSAAKQQLGPGHTWTAASIENDTILALRDLAPPPPAAFWTNFRKTFETP